MARSKKAIETYKQFRTRIGNQKMPSLSEIKIYEQIYKEEMSRERGEHTWALMLVYIAGKIKGAGMATEKDIEIIAEKMLIEQKEKAHTNANSESSNQRH